MILTATALGGERLPNGVGMDVSGTAVPGSDMLCNARFSASLPIAGRGLFLPLRGIRACLLCLPAFVWTYKLRRRREQTAFGPRGRIRVETDGRSGQREDTVSFVRRGRSPHMVAWLAPLLTSFSRLHGIPRFAGLSLEGVKLK